MGKRGILITLIILLIVSSIFIITGVLFEQKFLPITGAFWSGVWVSQISMAIRLDNEPKKSEEFKELKSEKLKYKVIDITNESHRIMRNSISFRDAIDYLDSLGYDDIQADFDLESNKVFMICFSGGIKTAVYKIEKEN